MEKTSERMGWKLKILLAVIAILPAVLSTVGSWFLSKQTSSDMIAWQQAAIVKTLEKLDTRVRDLEKQAAANSALLNARRGGFHIPEHPPEAPTGAEEPAVAARPTPKRKSYRLEAPSKEEVRSARRRLQKAF